MCRFGSWVVATNGDCRGWMLVVGLRLTILVLGVPEENQISNFEGKGLCLFLLSIILGRGGFRGGSSRGHVLSMCQSLRLNSDVYPQIPLSVADVRCFTVASARSDSCCRDTRSVCVECRAPFSEDKTCVAWDVDGVLLVNTLCRLSRQQHIYFLGLGEEKQEL